MAQSGRRPGPGNTSAEILAAARVLFAAGGFQATTVRAIATAAGVNPAMVHHFFGSKDELFLAALDFPINPLERVLGVIAVTRRDRLGAELVRLFVGIWRDPASGTPLQAALRGATTSDQAARMLRTFAAEIMLPRVSTALGLTPASVAGAVSQLLGFALVATILEIEPLASTGLDDVVALLGPAVQTYIDRADG